MDASGSNTHTFGRVSLAQTAEAKAKKEEQHSPDDEMNDEIDRAETFGRRETSIYQKDVIDPNAASFMKKGLLYDKSLKAYYDPETGQYFEMKTHLIP